MGDPLKKVQDGERLRIPAAAYNAFIDAARRVRAEQQGVGAKPLRSSCSTSIILVQNNSGANVGRFGVLGIDRPIVGASANLDQFKEQVALSGISPTSGHAGKFVILLEPLADGAIGQAVVDGVAPCRVVFTTGTETRADVSAGDTTRLNASGGGSAQVLWKESGTGEKWAVVRLETAVTSSVRFRTTAPLALGGTAAAVIRVWDGAAYQNGEAIVVEDYSSPGRWSAISGAEGVAFQLPDKSEYVILWVEHQAIFATATLSANMTGGTAACTFTDHWQGPLGTGTASQVYDVDGRYGGLVTGDKVLACWDDIESKYKICDAPQTATKEKWAYARTDWVNAAANGSYVPCDSATGKDGASTGIDIGNIYLPRGGDYDPDVRQGEIIAYTETEDGFKIAKGYVSDRIGTIKVWSGSIATIARGWHLCDGTNGTPDLRERFILGASGDSGGDSDFDGEGGNTFVGQVGGLKRKLINWDHTNFGSPLLRTFNTLQEILQTQSFHTEKEDPPLDVEVSASGTGTLDGETDYAPSDVEIITERGAHGDAASSLHWDHIHPLAKTIVDVEFGSAQLETLGLNPHCDTSGSYFGTGTQEVNGSPDAEMNCVYFNMEHYIVEPGEGQGGYTHPINSSTDPPGIPVGKTGHKHAFSGVTIDASSFDFDANLVWEGGDYDGHYHWVQSGTLDGKLAIRDVTHDSPAGCPINEHYHDFHVDNHQEFIYRVPPYYALAYIQRLN